MSDLTERDLLDLGWVNHDGAWFHHHGYASEPCYPFGDRPKAHTFDEAVAFSSLLIQSRVALAASEEEK